MSEGLMHFFRIQAPMTDQLTIKQQHRYLVAIARPGGEVAIDIDHIDADSGRCRQCGEFAQHFLAQTAARA